MSAWEAVSNVAYEQAKTIASVPVRRADYPQDSIHTVVAGAAQAWLARLSTQDRTGLQLDAYGRLAIMAEQDDLAQRSFANRLATSGLSITDKAYTLGLAVHVFADPNVPNQLPIAERYLTQLNALGVAAVTRRLYAECDFVRAYAALHRYTEAAQHGLTAVALTPAVPYLHREILITSEWLPDVGDAVYPMIVEALKHTPNGRVALDAMHATLRQALVAPADLVALDPAVAFMQQSWMQELDVSIKVQRMVGDAAPPLTSNYWINTSDSTSHAIVLNDGKIRLLEFGGQGCGPCIVMFSALQRIGDTFGARVEPIVVTHTSGWWANRLVAPEEESVRLKEYFMRQRQVHYPVAIYRLDKTINTDGDRVSDFEADPNYRAYAVVSKPTVYVVDGRGTIRHVFLGYSRELEMRMIETVRSLLAESSRGTPRLSSIP